eukprot:GHVS01108892.1.p1 GENE.GHVS01108892.1~~GHVS01108892.1.p1  ORF type:complete len:603 (+),score=110.44 GHVS01108892.1:230-1810(+)
MFAAEVSESMIFKVVIGVVLIIMVVGLVDSFAFPPRLVHTGQVRQLHLLATHLLTSHGLPLPSAAAHNTTSRMELFQSTTDPMAAALRAAVAEFVRSADTSTFFVQVMGVTMFDRSSQFANLSPFERTQFRIGWTVVKASIRDCVRRWAQSNLLLALFITTLIFFGLFFFNRDSNRLAQKLVYPLQALADDVEAMAYLDTHGLSGPVEGLSKIYEIRQLQETFELMRQGLLSFAKYVPREVVGIMLRRGEGARLGGEPKVVSIVFSDIVGFTTIAEQLSPRLLLALLSEYFEGMSNIILRSRGTLIEFIGDAILAVWNAPLTVNNHTSVAIAQCLRMQAYLVGRRAEWRRLGFPVIRIRCGIHAARVLVGNLGSPDRIKFGVLGDGVNLASRLEELNKRYGTSILISEAAANEPQVRLKFLLRPVDIVVVKGRTQGTQLFEVINFRAHATTQETTIAQHQSDALQLYLSGNFSGCLETISLIESMTSGGDNSLVEIKRKAQKYLQQPPPSGWSGAEILSEKTFCEE